jgi:serine O-acetyltransferase
MHPRLTPASRLLPPHPLLAVWEEHHPSQGWKQLPHHLSRDELWLRVRAESKADAVSGRRRRWRSSSSGGGEQQLQGPEDPVSLTLVDKPPAAPTSPPTPPLTTTPPSRPIPVPQPPPQDAEPTLASFLYSTVLAHRTFEQALAFVLANKLASATLFSTQIKQIAEDVYAEEPGVIDAAMADLQAVVDRDPACDKYAQALLHFKGYQAIQSHRVAHHLWRRGRRALALLLQSRISEAFHVDIHPAAAVGRGILLDHATGVVIGETATIGDNVSMLHHVTLGGSGVGKGARHPQIGHGVLLGAGVTVLGPVTLGAGAKVGAGSVVVTDLEAHSVAVGVPARVIKRAVSEPCEDMDQTGFLLDYVI